MQSFSTSRLSNALLLLIFPFWAFSDDSLVHYHSISPNFTTTQLQSIDNKGAFLSSDNGTFTAALSTLTLQPLRVYFSVLHTATGTIVWSANRDDPVSDSAALSLTTVGLTIADESGYPVWSTPPLSSPVAALQLLDTGNLVLVDARDVPLWQSFDQPTDTLVARQRLRVGRSLVSAAAADDLSSANYSLTLGVKDLALEWFGQAYWRLSMDANAFQESNKPISYMEMDHTGFYLHGDDDSSSVIIKFIFEKPSNFTVARLRHDGQFEINGFNGEILALQLMRPAEFCRVPNICGKMGLCSLIDNSETRQYCRCPEGFRGNTSTGCLPDDNSLSLPSACNITGNGSREMDWKVPKYLKLGNDSLDYFSKAFVVEPGVVNLSVCQDLCSQSCSCLGLVYQNYARYSCYLIENYLGSVFEASEFGLSVYLKAFQASKEQKKEKPDFPVAGFVLIPLSGFCIIIAILVLVSLWLQKRRTSMSISRRNSSSFLGTSSLLGLPLRFEYDELVEATENFKTVVGSGGFGTVYKGTLPDQTVVAVKKITNLGVQGKKEFVTELATIGTIHHVNLVRLKGFCAQGRCRFLVYEFMNRGSLERILFGNGPVLEWRDRFRIALGTARALAYLHSGCHPKIIHCDIKPENILLNDRLQVKVSDFGLSKLIDPETSKLVTAMRGTRGYLAPEWLIGTSITDKTDVYSYGMVLLEIVSGKRNLSLLTENSSVGEEGGGKSGPSLSSPSLKQLAYFPSLAVEMHKQGRYLKLADPRLEGRVRGEEVEKVVRVALCCVHVVPELRPTMDNVVAMFEGRLALGEPRVEALRFLQSFGGR